ncbi:MAG: Do family serine endopeptidase [Desulfobacterales bacterium]|nr:MAG: Do family serine endopeptidase [Desulfobacterales bacterium]
MAKKLKSVISALSIVTVLFLFVRPNILYADHDRENAVVRAVRKVSPVVVNISTEFEVRTRTNPFSGFGFDSYFDSFFRDFFEPGFERRYKRTSLGSGVIIDGKRGFILTNEHVIKKTGAINVVLKDGREFSAHIVGADPDSDLAVLRITSKKPLPGIEMGDSDDIMIGETVFAIGNPFGFSNTVTTGVISATNRSFRVGDTAYHDFIQTDASINPGNSGGPLLNINGDLIGINTAIYAKAQGIGFAIPINKAKRIVSDLIKYGEVVHAWIGITVQKIDKRLSQYLNLSENKGVLVQKVEKSSPAHKAGISNGDIILSVGKTTIYSEKDYQAVRRDFAEGKTIDINILRDGKEKRFLVKATVFPKELAMDLAYNLLGITVENLSLKNRYQYKTDAREGVVIADLHPQSYLAHIGARPGDIIRQMNDITINNTNDFEKAVIKYRQKSSVVILLQRGNQLYNITVKL